MTRRAGVPRETKETFPLMSTRDPEERGTTLLCFYQHPPLQLPSLAESVPASASGKFSLI